MNEEKGVEHNDEQGETQAGKTLRQNNTRFGVVFPPRTLFITWQSKQEKEARQQTTHLDGIIQVAQPFEIPVHHNTYNALTII
jgi:hypothetical protein